MVHLILPGLLKLPADTFLQWPRRGMSPLLVRSSCSKGHSLQCLPVGVPLGANGCLSDTASNMPDILNLLSLPVWSLQLQCQCVFLSSPPPQPEHQLCGSRTKLHSHQSSGEHQRIMSAWWSRSPQGTPHHPALLEQSGGRYLLSPVQVLKSPQNYAGIAVVG